MAPPPRPQFGITGMPAGQIPGQFPDMLSERLEAHIEAYGTRLVWTRASECPCTSVNDQTRQPDPNCSLCDAEGLIYFGPQDYVIGGDVGELTDTQRSIVTATGGAVIRGLLAREVARRGSGGTAMSENLNDTLGHWIHGHMIVTVRQENALGYLDRLVAIDSHICYFEVVTATANSTTVPLRYRTTGVNLLRTTSTVYTQNIHFTLESGVITWLPSQIPSTDLRLSVHYLTPPTWRVIDYPHVIRGISRRNTGAELTTPLGTPTKLPIQAHVRLDFLPVEGVSP